MSDDHDLLRRAQQALGPARQKLIDMVREAEEEIARDIARTDVQRAVDHLHAMRCRGLDQAQKLHRLLIRAELPNEARIASRLVSSLQKICN